jgi:carbon monoxide dehydrogenase subunit G
MKISGEATMHAPIERVWEALHDPAVLARTIPGCERLQAAGPGAYLMTVTGGVASTRGTYAGTARVHDSTPPSSFAMSASGAGARGTVGSDVRVRLSEVDGSTRLSYDADATVGGLIGGVGQRLLASVAQRTADEFLAAVNDVLTGEPEAVSRTELPARRSVPPGVLVAAAVGFAAGAVWGRRRC